MRGALSSGSAGLGGRVSWPEPTWLEFGPAESGGAGPQRTNQREEASAPAGGGDGALEEMEATGEKGQPPVVKVSHAPLDSVAADILTTINGLHCCFCFRVNKN